MTGKKKLQASRVADRISHARRNVLKLTQAEFATRMDVSQANVSKWESGKLEPETHHLMKLASLLDGRTESLYFLEAAGVPAGFFMGDPRYAEDIMPSEFGGSALPVPPLYQVPLLRDAAAAGTPRAMEENEIEAYIPVLKSWMPRGSALVAMRVSGDSMSPILLDSYVVVIDMAQRDPKKLVGKMVAARSTSGVTIKWLRNDSGIYMLIPQHTSPRFPIAVLNEGDGWGIVGAVVHWMGFPPAARKAPPNL